MKKENLILILVIAIFGGLGIYLTFISGNTDKYDSQVDAYQIDPNESYDSDGSTYYPIYYYRVNDKEYTCKAKVGSSSYPSESKKTVYYDSKDPSKCKTQYEKSTGKTAGIICLIVAGVIIVIAIKKPNIINTNNNESQPIDIETQRKIEETTQKAVEIVDKIQLIFKRVIIGIIIVILLVFTLFDFAIIKQTIKAKDYIDTKAVYVENQETIENSDSVFTDYKYSFVDKNGNNQEITYSVPKDEIPKNEINIKYNENNPQEYFEEGTTMNKSGIILFVVKAVALILLIVLFFNKKLLSKINISAH